MTTFKPSQNTFNDYIQNKLNEVDIEQLEIWLADNPDVRKGLELDLMFKHGINKQSASKKHSKSFSFFDLFTNRKLVPLHLFAYGLVGFLLFNIMNNTNKTPQNSAAIFIELEKQRGAKVSELNIKSDINKNIVIRFFPDSITGKYSLIMKSKTTSQEIILKGLVSDDFGSITTTLNNKPIIGVWKLYLTSEKDNSVEQIYLLNIAE